MIGQYHISYHIKSVNGKFQIWETFIRPVLKSKVSGIFKKDKYWAELQECCVLLKFPGLNPDIAYDESLKTRFVIKTDFDTMDEVLIIIAKLNLTHESA